MRISKSKLKELLHKSLDQLDPQSIKTSVYKQTPTEMRVAFWVEDILLIGDAKLDNVLEATDENPTILKHKE